MKLRTGNIPVAAQGHWDARWLYIRFALATSTISPTAVAAVGPASSGIAWAAKASTIGPQTLW